ncbi:MAG: aldo/keto reductase [Bacilli bacterium]|nr:aldo/keto reductase [Bacilli bacterium]
MDELELLNGVKIPIIGYGTWLIKNKDATNCVKMAIEAGYTHIDTAQAYGNEEGVGKAIRECGKDRSELFVTTKVAAELKTYKKAKKSIDESLKKLDIGYIDLVLIHCPQPWLLFRGKRRFFKENIEVWKALEEAYKEGKVKAIGVSNFLIDDLENIMNNCEIKPMVNQVLCHIGNTPSDVIKFCQENDIVVEAYSPIAHGAALKNEAIIEMAKKYNVSVAQLCIQYTLQLNTVSLPKASSKEHIEDNIKVNFGISDEDMISLIKLNEIDYGKDAFWPVFNKKNKAN